jgi:uncharacterized protein YecE (DUF72 family)
MQDIRIGVSGWRYTPWRGSFYPQGLPQRAELDYAGSIFNSVEINGSFYSLQWPQSWALWYSQTPADFIFAVKGPRFITHMKRLRDVEKPLANFFASGVFLLREKLGPILWQFPPQFRFDAAKMRSFFELLPFDTEAALRLAWRRDQRLHGRACLRIDENRLLRHAVEIRHESFLTPEFVQLLREFNIALVVAETANRWPLTFDVTADFIYVRLHGDETLYQSGYSDEALERWAGRIRCWHGGKEPADVVKIARTKAPAAKSRPVFCYFDNTDVKLRAPHDAQALMRMLGLTPGKPIEAPYAREPRKVPPSSRRVRQTSSSRGSRLSAATQPRMNST